MKTFLLLVLLTFSFQIATASVVQHQDVIPAENNFEAKVNPIRMEEKDLVTINGTRYYFSLLEGNLYGAHVTCQEFGMELVSFETQQKTDSIYAYMQANGIQNTRYYTSGIKIYSNWKWHSSYLDYNNWAPGKPDQTSTTAQACIYYYNGLFYDDNCSFSKNFICEDAC